MRGTLPEVRVARDMWEARGTKERGITKASPPFSFPPFLRSFEADLVQFPAKRVCIEGGLFYSFYSFQMIMKFHYFTSVYFLSKILYCKNAVTY